MIVDMSLSFQRGDEALRPRGVSLLLRGVRWYQMLSDGIDGEGFFMCVLICHRKDSGHLKTTQEIFRQCKKGSKGF